MSYKVEKIAVIGRAFSGTAIAEDLHLQFENLGITGQTVTYFGPEDVGLAYRAQDPNLILNRDVKTMNAFDGTWADYERHLERQYQSGEIDELYVKSSFPPRSTFGSLIRETNDSHDDRYKAQGNHLDRVEDFVIKVRKQADGTYTLLLKDGSERGGFTKIVNATGHEVVRDDALVGHKKVFSPYIDPNWEDDIKLAARSVAQKGGEIVFIGGGGTSLDAGTLAGKELSDFEKALVTAHDTKATLRFFSEYGDTSHNFFSGVSASQDVTSAIKGKLPAFFESIKHAGTDKAKIGLQISNLIKSLEAANPRIDIGNGDYKYPENYIYPQFVLAELLADKRIRTNENELLLKGVIAFNGNPIAPERQKLWAKLKADGRVEIENKRVKVKWYGPDAVWLYVDGEDNPRYFDGIVIRTDEIRRGAVLENGLPVNPALRSQHEAGLIRVSTVDDRVYPNFSAQDPNIFNVGAATYADANSVKKFREGTLAIATQIAASIKGSIQPENLISLLNHRRKDGGLSLRIVDARKPSEDADVEILKHPSLDIRRVDYLGQVKDSKFGIEDAEKILPKDNVPTIVVCAGGKRSAALITHLESLGYTNLINAYGGISALIAQVRNVQQLDYFAGKGIEANRAAVEAGGVACASDPCGGSGASLPPARIAKVASARPGVT